MGYRMENCENILAGAGMAKDQAVIGVFFCSKGEELVQATEKVRFVLMHLKPAAFGRAIARDHVDAFSIVPGESFCGHFVLPRDTQS